MTRLGSARSGLTNPSVGDDHTIAVPDGLVPVQSLVEGVQELTRPTSARVIVTVAALLSLLLAAALIQIGRRRLNDRGVAPDDAEAIGAVAFALVAVTAAGVILAVWRAFEEVLGRVAVFDLSVRQGALALVAGLVLVIAYTLTRVSKGLFEERGADGDVIDRHRREAIHHVVQIAVLGLATAFVLALAGVRPGDLLVGAGAAGLVLGLAARQTLGAVFAGFVLLFARPFEIGDWVVLDEIDGVVTDVSLFNTRVRTWDGEHVIVPNDQITATQIVNRTRENRLRVSVDVGVDYDTDIERAATIAREAMVEVDDILADPAPEVVTKRFGDSAIVLQLRFWIDDPSAGRKWTAQTAVVRAVKSAFDGEGVKIPFPQRELSGRESPVDIATGRTVDSVPQADGDD